MSHSFNTKWAAGRWTLLEWQQIANSNFIAAEQWKATCEQLAEALRLYADFDWGPEPNEALCALAVYAGFKADMEGK